MGLTRLKNSQTGFGNVDKKPLISDFDERYSNVPLSDDETVGVSVESRSVESETTQKANGKAPTVLYEDSTIYDKSTQDEPNDPRPRTFMERVFPTGFKHEFVGLIKYSWPMVATTVLNVTIRSMATMFSGHLGKIELDSVAMALSIANVIGTSIGIGLIAACDTLFSQSFGSSNKIQVGIYLQTAIYVSSLCCVISWGLLANTNMILLALGQDPLVARYTEEYLNYFMAALEFLFLYQLLSRYLQVQGYVLPCVFVGILSNLINIGLQYTLVYPVGLGLTGSAISQVVAYFSLGMLTLLYTRVSGAYKGTWGGFSRKSLQDWGQFLKLGISSILMICLEWWAFEIGTFLMGILGSTELGASSILMTLWGFYSAVSVGVGSASAYRAGRYLGAQKPKNAITSARVAFCAAWIIAIITALITMAFKSYIPYLFTNDPDVVELATELLPILALFSLAGSTRNICSGIIRGTGNQAIGGLTSFVSYFVFGLPIGISLMFLTDTGAAGFWWGLTIGLTINTTSLFVIIYKIDWEKEAQKALVRAKVKASRSRQTSTMEETPITSTNENNGLLANKVKESLIKKSTQPTKKSGGYGALRDSTNDVLDKSNRQEVTNSLSLVDRKQNRRTYWRVLFIKRGLICFCCFALLAFGIICRQLIFIPPYLESKFFGNSTTLAKNLTVPQS